MDQRHVHDVSEHIQGYQHDKGEKNVGWQPETQPKGKPPVEKTEGAETMQRLIDKQDAFNVLTDYYHHSTHVQHLALQEALNKVPTVDAVPLDGSFLKMSRGDYLIYKRHWLYEHFDQEIDIQRSVMKSMGYEPALKDAQPHWTPCSERLPENMEPVNITWVNRDPGPYYMHIKDKPFTATGIYFKGQWYWWSSTCADMLCEYGHTWIDRVDDGIEITAWMPLPKPYEVEDEKTD